MIELYEVLWSDDQGEEHKRYVISDRGEGAVVNWYQSEGYDARHYMVGEQVEDLRLHPTVLQPGIYQVQ